MGEGERQLLQWVVLGLIVAAIRQFVVWIRDAKPAPDPWGPEVETALQEEATPPTCPYCSATHAETDWFCPGCGRSVGFYNNYSPYLYIFSFGDLLRRGTSESFRVNWLTIAGYVVLSFQYFTVGGIFFMLAGLCASVTTTSVWMALFCAVVRAISLVLGTVCLWLVPIYCYQLLRNVRRQLEAPASEPGGA